MKAKIKLEEIVMDAVVDESPSMTAEVTEKPVEKGEDIADHMKQKPYTIRLSGSIVNDAPAKLELLRSYQKDAKLLKYAGRNIFADVVLTNLSTKHSVENATGFDYEITLQHVRIAQPETFEVKVKNPKTGKQDAKTASKVKKRTNVGRKQITKRGTSKSSVNGGNGSGGGGKGGGTR